MTTIYFNKNGRSALVTGFALAIILGAASRNASAQEFTQGDLLVSSSLYEGTASTVTVGQTLPGGGTANHDGTYPGVWNNESVDASFGVTAPIFIDQLTTSGASTGVSVAVDPSLLTTSFPSKSELGLSLSADGTAVTFMGYAAPINSLDISNANTPGVQDPGNPDTATPTYRVIAQLNANGTIQTTDTNAYPGNNGRNAILGSNGSYYTVGNAGNGGSGPSTVIGVTGVQQVTPGAAPATTPTSVGSYNITQNGYAADKVAKDNNFRGETIFNNTLYVTKGSGSNGINTVYQVGTAGSLPTGTNNMISVLPGFSTTLAKGSTGVQHPFGLFFANSTTLYVADEGDGVATHAGTASDPTAGLGKWSLISGTWHLDYTLSLGLNLGTQYSVSGLDPSLDPATDGLRNITGKVNGDGTVSIFGITSTVSSATDQGADPNKLVSITDNLSLMTSSQASGESFTTLESAANGEVLRGVSFAPVAVPEPSILSLLLMVSGMGAAFGAWKRKSQTLA